MNNSLSEIKTASLFERIPEELSELFCESEYPWEIVPHIGEYLKEHIKKEGLCEIFPDVFVSADVKIAKSAEIQGPAVILSGAEIRHGAYIRGNAFIGRGTVVGNSCEIKNAILFDGAQVPHYNYVGDSILGTRAHMGAGAITSNLKSLGTPVSIHAEREINTGLRKLGAILGDCADVGAGCVLNPGTIIGRGSVIYPLTSLRGVVPSGVIVKRQNEFTKRV